MACVELLIFQVMVVNWQFLLDSCGRLLSRYKKPKGWRAHGDMSVWFDNREINRRSNGPRGEGAYDPWREGFIACGP